MDTTPITPARLAASVIAVPPLARDAQERITPEENGRIIRHLEAGGVNILLYGGNANLYHARPSEYARLLVMLRELAAPGTLVIPSAGPAYGVMLDQAEVLRDFAFPTVMVLPHAGFNSPAGVAAGLRRFAERLGRPVVVYVKQVGYLAPEDVARLTADGVVSWVKYALVRPDPADDPWLRRLLELVPAERVISGIGEQPAVTHLRDFGLGGYTSGCVCVAPALSTRMLAACRAGDWTEAERIRELLRPLEDLRNAHHPVRVLHEAVRAAGIAETGPLLPLLHPVTVAEGGAIRAAALALRAAEAGA